MPPVNSAHTASRRTGVIALVLALVAAVLPPLTGAITGYIIGSGMVSPATAEQVASRSFLSPVRGWVLVAEIAFWVGTVLGLWALIQGIVAVARGRGRGTGVAAIIVAVLALVVFAIATWGAVVIGVVSST